MARHKGEKSFKCPHCEKSFYSATDLKVSRSTTDYKFFSLHKKKKKENNQKRFYF